MSWHDFRLGDVLTLQRGHELPNTIRLEGDVPVVSSSGITGHHNEAKATAPGVVTGRYGTIGEVFYIEQDYWPLNTALYVTDFKGNHPRFIAYLLRNVLRNYKSDKAAVPGVNRNVLHEIKILFPDIQVQQRIASILSTYDDLIENNRRRIQLLEQAARLLYKEWFVHLRFPGHEHSKIQNGVPEGWEKQTLANLAKSVSYGFTASSSKEEIDPKFLRITDIVPTMVNWDEVPFCKATEENIQRNRLEVGDVVVARTGATVGYAKRISFLKCQTVYASYLVRFRFHTPAISFIAGIFMESDAYKDYVKNHAGGAAQPNANAKVLGSAVLLIPPKILQEQFSDSISVIFCQRDTLIRHNLLLAKARALLLPRLMDGSIAT